MRAADFDITESIRTTDPIAVGAEVVRLYRGLYPEASPREIGRAFDDMARMYHGEHPDYHPCDTPYHDIQHVLDVTLTMARLLDGYARGAQEQGALLPEHFGVGVVTALFHDVGYLRRRDDREHRYGAEYTLIHVSRGSAFLRGYLPGLGWERYAAAVAEMVHFTGYERPISTIRVEDPLLRRVGEILGTADILAQMADRCYLEKCRDRLYPEFVLGGLALREQADGTVLTVYASGIDLVHKTPVFYANARKRLDEQLNRAYVYAERHFGGRNPYLEEMDKNVRYAQLMATEGNDTLRRKMPRTLPPRRPAYEEDLVIR
jgi:hypothetical protein